MRELEMMRMITMIKVFSAGVVQRHVTNKNAHGSSYGRVSVHVPDRVKVDCRS